MKLRQRDKRVPVAGVAGCAFLLFLLGLAMISGAALGGLLIGLALLALVYCAWHMGQRGLNSEFRYEVPYHCWGDPPCGNPTETEPERPAAGGCGCRGGRPGSSPGSRPGGAPPSAE